MPFQAPQSSAANLLSFYHYYSETVLYRYKVAEDKQLGQWEWKYNTENRHHIVFYKLI